MFQTASVMNCLLLAVSALVALSAVSLGDDSENLAEEFCQLETMKGRCRWKSEVIVIMSARWGRMKNGRCLNIHPNMIAAIGHDPQFLGCSADVLQMIDKKCSGRSECDIRIPDADLDTVTPCYPDVKSYLETTYTCVKVVQESRSCVVMVTSDQQYISSLSLIADTSSTSGCGSKSHPWRLQVPAGQRINISILDFSGSVGLPVDRDVTCRQYGYIVDKSNKKNVSICGVSTPNGDKLQREDAVYTSLTNNVDIVLVTGGAENYNFLLKLNAVGCTNMIPPDNAWLKRSNNDIVIGCYLSQQTWQLKCDGHDWKGQVGICPETYNPVSSAATTSEPESDHKLFLAMIVIGGGAFIVCITIVAIGIMSLKRCKRNYKQKKSYLMADETLCQQNVNTTLPETFMIQCNAAT